MSRTHPTDSAKFKPYRVFFLPCASLTMLYNYLKVILRNIYRHKLISFINIFSLSIGIAITLVIYIFIYQETSFDQFHSQKDHLYRLDEIQSFPGTNTQKVALSMPGMGPNLKADFPEIIEFTRFWVWGKQTIVKDETRSVIERLALVDTSFLELFDFEMISGDRTTALDEPNSIVVTESMALQFFTDTHVIGQVITRDDLTLHITGVMKDVPDNSHLQFDGLISLSTHTSQIEENFDDKWGSNFLVTYLLLQPGSDIESLEKKFPQFLIDHSGREDAPDYYQLFLQPFTEVHLGSMDIEHDYQNYRKFNGTYIGIFGLAGILMIIIAAINFMNLTIARAASRSREIGIRKSIGAHRAQVFAQFMTESNLMAVMALMLALAIAGSCLPLLSSVLEKPLNMSDLVSPLGLLIWLGLAMALGTLSGLYPALYLSSFEPVKVIKGINKTEGKSIFRSAMIITQFAVAIILIVGTLVVFEQLSFMKRKDVGFDKEGIILIPMSNEANDKFETIKEELTRNPRVLGVTGSNQRLGNNFHQWGFKYLTDSGMVNITPSNVSVEFDYLDVYNIRILKGRGFSPDIATDDGLAFVINESFAKELGYDDPIGKKAGHSWYPDDSLGTIIGVTQDFNFNSLHYKVNTLSMVVHSEWGYSEMSVKLQRENLGESIAFVQNTWREMVTDLPFSYEFLDDHFADLYKSDAQMSIIVTLAAGLSILVACLGLFGLSAITAEQRLKEISIRKVLGAGNFNIVMLFSRKFTLLLVVSFVIASPPTYWLLKEWLQNFAYRIDVSFLSFLTAALISLVITLGTISYHAMRTANSKPVDALQCE